MAKLYEQYLKMKGENKEKLYLFKSGTFYLFLDEDAKKVSEELGLKLSSYNKDISKCGFPIGEVKKYTKFLDLLQINYEIVTSDNDKVISEIIDLNLDNLDEVSLNEIILRWKEMVGNKDE